MLAASRCSSNALTAILYRARAVLGKAAGDEVLRGGVLVGPECRNQVVVSGDVLQPVEAVARAVNLEERLLDEILGGGCVPGPA